MTKHTIHRDFPCFQGLLHFESCFEQAAMGISIWNLQNWRELMDIDDRESKL